MRKYILFIFIFLIIISKQIFSQTVIVPLENDVYEFIERMQVKGLTNRCYIDMKPLSRKEVIRILMNIYKNIEEKNIYSFEKKQLTNYIDEFSYEKRFIDSEFKLKKLIKNGLELLTEKEIFIKDEKRLKKWNPLSFPYKFYCKNSYFSLNPIINIGYTYNQSDSSYFKKNNSLLSGGINFFGYLGKRIGFGFRGVNSRETGNDFDIKNIDNPEQGVGSLITKDEYYDKVDVYISYSTKYVNIILGKFSNYWGMGKTGSLSISNRAPSYPQIFLKTGFCDWLKFTYFHGWLESNIRDDSSSYWIDGEDSEFQREFYKKKYIAAHRLDISPISNLTISFSEILYYGETDPKLIYFIPIMLFWSAQHQTNDQDNEEVGFSIEWCPFDFCNLYSSLIIDDIKLSKIFNKEDSQNYLGYQIGTYLVEPFLPGLDFKVEYTHLNPWVYTHKYPINEATSDGYLMGYWTGQNSDNLYLSTKYQINSKLKISTEFWHYRKGAMDSIKYQYETSQAEKFLYGHQYTKNIFNFTLEYYLASGISFQLGFKHLDCDVNEKNIKLAEEGVYVNPVYYKSDFWRNSLSINISYGFK